MAPEPAWVVADIVRMEDGLLAEHWDVIQDEATREQSRSGLPMFGDKFPAGLLISNVRPLLQNVPNRIF